MSIEMDKPIKFSILIPTRNREELLKFAVESVLNQTYANWELIISDNCSDASVGQWVETLKETRIKYFRQERFVSVTENWNTANNLASGDYIIMLGDDDALFPNALEVLYKKLCNNDYPDLLMFYAYVYLHSGVDICMPNGSVMLADPVNNLTVQSGFIPKTKRWEMIERCFRFDYKVAFNMQFYCYSKNVVKILEKYGNFYEPPYPDYYTSCMLLLVAEKVLYIKDIITVIGVTPKSYGYYYRNNREREGMQFHKEADYREYAPVSVRDKLCSVDEIHTAAMATFALIPQRFEIDEPSLLDYYNQVLLREMRYMKIFDICELMDREMLPNLDITQKKQLINLLIKNITGYKVMDDSSFDNDENMPIFHNVLELMKDIDGQKLYVTLKNENHNDLVCWVKDINIELLKRKINNRKVLIWGAYDRGAFVKEWILYNNIPVYGFLDNDNNKNYFSNLPVYDSKFLCDHPKEFYVIIPLRTVYEDNIELLTKAGFDFMSDYIYIGYNGKIKAINDYYDIFGNVLQIEGKYKEIEVLFRGKNSKIRLENEIYINGKIVIGILNDQSDIKINSSVYFGENSRMLCSGKMVFLSGCKISEHADVIVEADSEQKIEFNEEFNIPPHTLTVWNSEKKIQIDQKNLNNLN